MRLYQINPLSILLLSLPLCVVAVPRKQHTFIDVEIYDSETPYAGAITAMNNNDDWVVYSTEENQECDLPLIKDKGSGTSTCRPRNLTSFKFETPDNTLVACIYADEECKEVIGAWSSSINCQSPGSAESFLINDAKGKC